MPSDAVYPVFGLVAALIVVIPLPWHVRIGNAGTIMLMIWLFIANLVSLSTDSVVLTLTGLIIELLHQFCNLVRL